MTHSPPLAAFLMVATIQCGVLPCTAFAQAESWQHFSLGGHLLVRSPSSSADGSLLAYTDPRTGSGDIYVLETKTLASRRFTADSRFESNPHFLPGEEGILFERESRGRRSIILKPLLTAEESQVTTGDVIDRIVDLSPDGRWLLVSRRNLNASGAESSAVWLIDLTNLNGPPAKIGSLALFVENDHIALNPATATVPSFRAEVVIRSIEGDGARRIGHGALLARDAAGKRLLIAKSGYRPESIDYNIGVLDVSSSAETVVGWGNKPCFLSSDAILYFQGYHSQCRVFKEGVSVEVSCPEGIIEAPQVAMSGNGVYTWVHQPGRRQFAIFHISPKTYEFSELLRIDESPRNIRVQR